MDQKIVYSKTGKGVLEIKNKGGKLSRELSKVLALVDGKSAVADLIAKSKLTEPNLARCLKQLEDGGYIKEFASLSGVMSSASTSGGSSYVDDLDFTTTLAPGKRVYSNAQSDFRARESAERERAEAEATRNRQAGEEQKKEQAKRQAREESVRMARIEAERKAKEAAAVKTRKQAELEEKRQAAEMARTTRDLAEILEAERKALDKSDGEKTEEKARRAKEETERTRGLDERRKREDEERRKREEDERRKREEDERRKREEDERRREEEEKRRHEEEEKRRREEEEKRRREDEERKRREEEDRRRKEEDQRREEEDRRKREHEEQRREEEDRRKREEEERRREEEEPAAPSFDLSSFEDINIPPAPEPAVNESEFSSFDLPSATPDSGENFTADFDKQQELLKKQAEDEERRNREAEEARLAMERAGREEDARLEAERRADVEAEMRARVEQEKEERADRERYKKEEYQRKIQEEEDRKKHVTEQRIREEQERVDAERKQREEALVLRRQGAEEADRKRRELKALKKAGKVHSPVESMKWVVVGVLVVIGLAVGAIQVIPMSGYIPMIEKIASDNIGEPVTIGSMKMSVLSGLEFKLSNVNVGVTQDVTLNDVTVVPELGSLFGDSLVVKSIRADGGTFVEEALLRLPSWRAASAADQRLYVRAIALHGVKLEMRTIDLPSLNADVILGRGGQVITARVETADRKVIADIIPEEGRVGVSIQVSNWTPPIGTPMEITDFTATGNVNGSVLNLSEWDATIYGGQAKGSARISWTSGWRASSQFEFMRVRTDDLLDAFTKTAKASGRASGKASFSASAGSLDTLLDRPTLRASFVVQKGNLDGVDLARALQVGSAGSQGGSTKFEELSGDVTISNGQYLYRNVVLNAGILSANGYFDIASDQDVRGRVSVLLRSSARRLSANLNVTGSLKGVLLRP